jgi:hypothetical protein
MRKDSRYLFFSCLEGEPREATERGALAHPSSKVDPKFETPV